MKNLIKAPVFLARRAALARKIRHFDAKADMVARPAQSGMSNGMLKTTIDALLDRPGLTARMCASELHRLPEDGKRILLTWDGLPSFLWEAVLNSPTLQRVVTDYIGPGVRLDDMYLKTVLDGLSSTSEGWHDDNVGYRLKVFMVFDTAGRPSGTIVMPRLRPNLYHVRMSDELARALKKPKMSHRPEELTVSYAPGSCLVFDTNLPHRGDYSSGEGVRYCVIAEFIDPAKADALRGKAPCGPGQGRRRIAIPALEGVDVRAHPLIDSALLTPTDQGFLYGYPA